MKLTRQSIARLPLPEDAGKKDTIYFDEEVAGFGVRCREGGSKMLICQYALGGKQRRMTLGSVNLIDPATARTRAKDILAAVRLGRDPAGEKLEARMRAAETFGATVERFLTRQKGRLKPRSYEEVARHLEKHSKRIHGLALAKIDRRTMAAHLAYVAEHSGAVAADRVRASISALFTWAVKEGLAEANPVRDTNKASEDKPRDRVLEDDELRQIWSALPEGDYGDICKLLMLTGQRREEIGGLRWSEVDADKALITLPPPRVKNKRQHEIPCSDPVVEILRGRSRHREIFIFGKGRGAFSGWSRCKQQLDEAIAENRGKPLANWVLHDLRRTMSTKMADELGIPPHIIDAVTNHVSGQSIVHRTYNYAQYRNEKRQALDRWAEHVMAIVNGSRSNITPLRRA